MTLPAGNIDSSFVAWTDIADGLRALQSAPPEPFVIEKIIKALCRLNLGGIAAHLIHSLNASGDYIKMKEQWLAQAHQANSGKTVWASRRRRFAANLSALAPASSDLAPLAAFWEQEQHRYELYMASDGNALVYDTQCTSPFQAILSGLKDHHGEALRWAVPNTSQQLIHPIIFNGAGYGWLLTTLLNATAKSYLNYSCPIYVVDSDPAATSILLHVQDLRFAPERLRFFVGQDAVAHLCEALRRQTSWSLPGLYISVPMRPEPPLPIEQNCRIIAEERKAKHEQTKQEINAYYNALPIQHWQKRFSDALHGKAQLTVLGITTRYSTVLQYSIQELGEAIRAAGHHFVLSMESDDQSLERPDLELIRLHKPDLMIQLSRMRYESRDLPRHVPFLCWDQDYLPCMRTREAKESLDALTFVAGHGAMEGFLHDNWPERNCIFIHAAGQWHRYHQPLHNTELLKRFACDISYISNASDSPESMYQERRGILKDFPSLLSAVDECARQIMSQSRQGKIWTRRDIVDLMAAVIKPNQTNPALNREIEHLLQLLSDRAYRHVTLKWVADYCRAAKRSLRLYGNGWERNAEFSSFAAGPATPGEEVLAIYQATRINLQIIETAFIHSRLLDGIAAGGFFAGRISSGDFENLESERATFNIVDWIHQHNSLTYEQLTHSKEPVIRDHWPQALEALKRSNISGESAAKMLSILNGYRPLEHFAPNIRKVRFNSYDEFARIADLYLNNESLRLELMQEMKDCIKEHFSYDARWQQFISGIHRGLINI